MKPFKILRDKMSEFAKRKSHKKYKEMLSGIDQKTFLNGPDKGPEIMGSDGPDPMYGLGIGECLKGEKA